MQAMAWVNMQGMKRTPIAIIAGIVGLFVYAIIVLKIGDVVQTMHWGLQAVYYTLAGSLWVLPIRWLMLWAAHMR